MTQESFKAAKPLNILLINGPILGMLGKRNTDIYGTDTLEEIEGWIITKAQDFCVEVNCFQSESEGDIIKFLMQHYEDADGTIINPGAYAHYSYALRECLECMRCPSVEVHITNRYRREEFRQITVTGAACDGVISGLGKYGYYCALMYLIDKIRERDNR